jgi:hypothetical protein
MTGTDFFFKTIIAKLEESFWKRLWTCRMTDY